MRQATEKAKGKVLPHLKKAKARKSARKQARKARQKEWSANRPKPTDADMSVVQHAAKLLAAGTGWEQADKTGLCASTIYRFRNGNVYEPRFRTLQMIAKANGGRMVFVKDN